MVEIKIYIFTIEKVEKKMCVWTNGGNEGQKKQHQQQTNKNK